MHNNGHKDAAKQSAAAHKDSRHTFKHEAGEDSMAHQDAAGEYFDSK